MKPLRPWPLIATRNLGSYRVFNLRANQSQDPRSGKIHEFYAIDSLDWVQVLPVTDAGEVVMIHQFRHGIQEVTLEIPGGLVDPGLTPEQAAGKELLEETGYRAEELIPLGWVHPQPAVFSNRCFAFLAPRVIPGGMTALEDTEDIAISLVHPDSLPNYVREGRITNAMVLITFYLYELWRSGGSR
jgi:8-oxo-dGTP pyrophosphatase MutT (NUDIX family)